MEYIYSVWFRNALAEPEDEDYEWVACLQINADSCGDALYWGDRLSKNYSLRNKNEIYLRSNIESKMNYCQNNITGPQTLPTINYGEEKTDIEIGW